jgi:Zn-dependent protease
MRTSLRIGKVAGIDIGFNWSFIVIAWLITWSLSSAALPETFPGHSDGAYWAAGISIAVLFFASLLTHELAHSLLARRSGVTVTEITLWMLGGVSKFESESETADDELQIAAVGPLTSLGLFFFFGVVATAGALLGLPELVVAVPSLVSALNLMIGVFNLVPAFPLDGGRVLRGFLWKRNGDKLAATRTAAQTGRILGSAMIAFGLIIVMGGAPFNGVWLAFIGLFILFAATVEATQSESQELLKGVLVGEVMTPDPFTVPAGVSVQELVDSYILKTRASAYPVLDDHGDLVGLVTLDRVRAVAPSDRVSTDVRSVACPRDALLLVTPDQALLDVLAPLSASREARALVVDGHRLVGIVSHTDVTRAMNLRSLARSTG